jgi:hypothetical protein
VSEQARLIGRVLLNHDLAPTEVRTYGLSRALQIFQNAVTGKSPFTVYFLMALLHAIGAYVVFRLMCEISADRLTSIYAGIAWFASPAVLPWLKVEHHFLYIVTPFVVLMGWLVLAQKRERIGVLPTAAAFTFAWLLGEGAIIAIGALVFHFGIRRRNTNVVIGGLIALALLGLYVASQIAFFGDPYAAQRIIPHSPSLKSVIHIFVALYQDARAVLGLRYWDPEIHEYMGSVKVFRLGITYVVAAMAFASVWLMRAACVPKKAPEPAAAIGFSLIAAFSIAVYALFALLRIGPLAVRYTSVFYTLLPIMLIGLVATRRSVRAARAAAGVIAALFLAISVALLARAEIRVNRPNRVLLTAFKPGASVVLRHEGWKLTEAGVIDITYPAFTPPFANGLQNPMRWFMVAEPIMRMYADVQLGAACRIRPDGVIDVIWQNIVFRTTPRENVVAFGFPSRYATALVPIRLEDVCTAGERGP